MKKFLDFMTRKRRFFFIGWIEKYQEKFWRTLAVVVCFVLIAFTLIPMSEETRRKCLIGSIFIIGIALAFVIPKVYEYSDD